MGGVGGWFEIWRVKLISTQVVVEVEVGVELGNIHNWLWAGSEPWVILELFLIFQDLSLMILIKIILIKKKCVIQPN